MGTPHRTITTDVYHFEQLSDEAKEKARDWWRELEASDPAWENERRESLEAFLTRMPLGLRDWSYDAWSYDLGRIEFKADPEYAALTGYRLAAHIWNTHRDLLYCAKQYRKGEATRNSKTLLVPTDCGLTGYYMDEVLLDPIRKFLANPTETKTWRDILEDCLNAWGQACVDDVASLMEDENVDDAIIANEYEFTVCGGHI